MADLVKIYQKMVDSLEAQRDAATTQGIKDGIQSLLDGAMQNLINAKAEQA